MAARFDGKGLLLGLALGLIAATGPSACDSYCGGERGEHTFRPTEGWRPYRYAFDVYRAPFHQDAISEGAMVVDPVARQVVVSYDTSAGEKVETWVIDVLGRRGSEDPEP